MDPLPPKPTPDQSAAHEFLTELRTRVTTQPLPYQFGVEARALESLWEVFSQARAAMKKYPGCEAFSDLVTQRLNLVIRPITAKWHRPYQEGYLHSRDGADAFRGDLAMVQRQLRLLAKELHGMAYGTEVEDALVGDVMAPADLDRCFKDVVFGIPRGTQNLPDDIVDGINAAEAEEVQRRRTARQLNAKEGHNAVGVAFSGGGIRSSTFCLGVTQVLAARGLLKDADFLSTVSGGGYTGSFLTVRLGTGTPLSEVAGPFGPDPAPVGYIRHHAKFLNPQNLKDAWSMVTGILAGMLLNWTAPLMVIALAALGAVTFTANGPARFWPDAIRITGALFGATLILYGCLLRGEKKLRVTGGKLLAATGAATLAAAAGWVIEKGYATFELLFQHRHATATLSLTGAATVLAAASPVIVGFLPSLRSQGFRNLTAKLQLALTALFVPFVGVLAFYAFRHLGDLPANDTLSVWNPRHFAGIDLLVVTTVVLASVAMFVLNINLTAPHRIYRERLAKTFIQTSETDDRPVPLTGINPTGLAPYHLINTTLNLPSSDLPALRDRKCAFFLFSKHWTGSATSGFHPTEEWKTNGRPVDLATAMAISGAATSAYAGLESKPTLTALLALLNIRLNFWIHRPKKRVTSEGPGFLCLLQEMAGVNMTEKSTWLNLSDGGHIENMAVYELLRRRCKFILCVDGEADPEFNFPGLLTLVRHAQIDFGIRIEPDVAALRPDPKTGFSRTHSLFCRVHYPVPPRADGTQPEPEIGLMLYVKLSVTGNETKLIERYRTLHPEFPHEPTSDQFFTEEQYEAYRQLGVHVAEGLFSPAVTNGVTEPATIREWFGQLASNLLVPE